MGKKGINGPEDFTLDVRLKKEKGKKRHIAITIVAVIAVAAHYSYKKFSEGSTPGTIVKKTTVKEAKKVEVKEVTENSRELASVDEDLEKDFENFDAEYDDVAAEADETALEGLEASTGDLPDVNLKNIKYTIQNELNDGLLVNFDGFNFFRRSSYEVSVGGIRKIEEISKKLKSQKKNIKIKIAGHTDGVVPFYRSYRKWNTNEELSKLRAKAVKDIFVREGFKSSQIEVIELQSVDTSAIDSGLLANRSITLKIEAN